MKHLRGSFIAKISGGFASVGILRYRAGAAEFTYKWSHDTAANHPLSIYANEAAQKIQQESNGRLEVRVFPNGQLGGQAQMLQLLRTGAVEMAGSFDSVSEAIVPAAGITAIPFAFLSHRAAWRALEGPLGKFLRTAFSKVGLYSFERCWDLGFRQIENSARPVHSVADLRGLKLRIPPSASETALFTALGASPVDVNGAEQVTALQTHLVDGLAITLPAFASRKMWELVKYVSMSNHILTNYHELIGVDAFARLPQDLREILERNVNVSGIHCSNESEHADIALQPLLKANGMVFTDLDRPAFRSAISAAGLYRQWRQRYGTEVWSLLEKAVGPMT